jgi:hypothetical protein
MAANFSTFRAASADATRQASFAFVKAQPVTEKPPMALHTMQLVTRRKKIFLIARLFLLGSEQLGEQCAAQSRLAEDQH